MEKKYLTRALMSFEDLEYFIQKQNKNLKRSNKYLCATALNGYDEMMVGVEKSLGHKRPLVSAHARFKIARTEADCVFPNSTDIDWRYAGPIIGLAVLGFINLAWSFRIAGVQDRIR